MKPVDVVKGYYAAFDAHDFDRARTLLHDNFRFVGPMMEASSPDELFSKLQAFDCDFKNHLLQTAENGNTVATIFDCVFTRPFSATIRMSEWFTVVDGKIATANLVYDTRQMAMTDPS